MPSEPRREATPKFPLRLMPSVRRSAELFSEREGVSLNQFINVAVAEKLAHLEHEEWVRRRKRPTEQSIEKALRVLDGAGSEAPAIGDEIPEGYRGRRVSVSTGASAKRSRV